jgi:hypothetical protein
LGTSGKHESLADLVGSYVEDHEISLVPEDPLREARTNTWSYSLSGVVIEEAGVVSALREVAAELRRRFDNGSAERVLRKAARLPSPGAIPWEELTSVQPGHVFNVEESDAPAAPFPVWALVIRN